jgi:hypothetical protein
MSVSLLILSVLALVVVSDAVGPQPMRYATSEVKRQRINELREWIPRWVTINNNNCRLLLLMQQQRNELRILFAHHDTNRSDDK